MDPIAIVAIITGLSGLSVAIFTHIKHSECCKGMIEFETRSERSQEISTPHPTPIAQKKDVVVREISV